MCIRRSSRENFCNTTGSSIQLNRLNPLVSMVYVNYSSQTTSFSCETLPVRRGLNKCQLRRKTGDSGLLSLITYVLYYYFPPIEIRIRGVEGRKKNHGLARNETENH